TKDQWTSAPYEVVFPPSRTIVDKEIASAKHKKVEIAGDAIAVDARTLKWDLRKRKLGKDEAIYFTIPERLRSKKLTKISLLQRQAEEDNSTALRGRFDDSPAYTSVQVYALSEDTDDLWRYWGGTFRHNNPKGSVFGELVAEDRMQPWHLEPWTNTK